MKPGVATALDRGQQPEDQPEQPRPGRYQDTDQHSLLPPQQQRRSRADPEQEEEDDSDPEEDEEEKARPLSSPDLPIFQLSNLGIKGRGLRFTDCSWSGLGAEIM